MFSVCKSGVEVNSTVLRPIIKGVIIACGDSHILKENGGKMKLSTTWINHMCRDMNLVMRRGTANAATLPSDWKEQLELVVLRLAFMVFNHPNITEEMVVNFDHTGYLV